MAATSASRRWARRAITTTAVAAVGLLTLAIPASAHTPDASAECSKDNVPTVTVSATSYELNGDNKTPNWIKIFVDGSDKAAIEQSFGVNLPKTPFPFDKLDATTEHTFKIVIKAWNDDDFENTHPNYSQILERKTKACKEKEHPTPPVENPPANPPANNPPAPQPAAAPAVASTELASTGVSIAIPLAIGALLLVGGGVLLLMMRRRGKA